MGVTSAEYIKLLAIKKWSKAKRNNFTLALCEGKVIWFFMYT